MRIVPLILLLAPLAPFSSLLAQRAAGQAPALAAPAACNGEMVTAIEIHSHPPGSSVEANVWKEVSGFAGMSHTTMNPGLINAYLRVNVGQKCTEVDRSESERLLRAQRFIASATVRPVAVGTDSVKIVVETVDDLGIIIGGSFQGAQLQSLQLGNENVAGRGLTIEASVERGFQYRTGYGGDIVQYGAFGHPYTLGIGGEVHPQGDALRFEFAKPFLTDLQPNGFHTGATEVTTFYDLTRPVGPDIFLETRRASYDAGFGVRIGPINKHGTVAVLGALVMGENVNTAKQGVYMTDTGFVAAPNSEIDNRYSAYSVLRAGLFAGIRALKFRTVRGYDAITAMQDVGIGTQFGVFAGPSVMESGHGRDFFASGDFYAGIGTPSSLLMWRVLGEGRVALQGKRWDGVVGFSKMKWYYTPNDVLTSVASVELSGVQHLAFPLQLSFWDHEGGLWGFPNALTVGGERAIIRFEERRVVSMITRRADWAIALFANAGKIWAGDVPFGQTSAVRAAAGISLLAAYPAGGKRMYRVDFAVPINPDGAKFELRFSSADDTRSIWRQPNDLAFAHSGAVVGNLGSWTPQIGR